MLTGTEYAILKKSIRAIKRFGAETGPFLPWHHSKDGYHWLIAESLLRRTTRTATEKAYTSLIQEFSSWKELSIAETGKIREHVAWLGLGQQRSNQLKKLAETISNQYKCEVPKSREKLLGLPGVGEYIADAILLYAHGQKYFPIDPNIQRVIRRIIGRPTPVGTRHSIPYSDSLIQEFSLYVKKRMQLESMISLHRGLLKMSWDYCRPKPACQKCFLISNCKSSRNSFEQT